MIHDVLTELAERMIGMHKEKQVRVEAFWFDLEAMTDGAISGAWRRAANESRALRKLGCAGFSLTWRTAPRAIWTSLGRDEQYFKAFVKMLVASVSNLSEVVRRVGSITGRTRP